MQNKQKNESEWGKNGVCMIKCCITKASEQPWSNSVASLPRILTLLLSFRAPCWYACILYQKPYHDTIMKLTPQLSTIHDLGPELFVGLM